MKICTCQNCGKQFEVEKLTGVKYCKDCKEKIHKIKLKEWSFLKKQEEIKSRGVEGIDYIVDLWNGYVTTRITGKWFNTYHPDRTIDEYIQEFPDAPLICKVTSEKLSKNTKERMNSPKWKQWASERMKGEKNINSKENTTLEQRQRISPFSKSFKNYDNMSDEEKEKEIRKNLQCDRDDRTSCQLNYWIKKGYSEDDARQLVSDRQRTFTLEKCIEKYGEEEGYEVFKERQIKWQKNFKHLNYSFISQELFWKIKELLNDDCYFAQNDNGVLDNSGKNHELRVKTSKSVVSIDFYYPQTNSIIEFDGDYWHSETRKYVNKTRDIDRDNSLKEVGYDRILHVREHDYIKDKEKTIQKCLNFILNKA